jgi:hypothetical protein
MVDKHLTVYASLLATDPAQLGPPRGHGPCAPPVKATHGWLNLFHGVRVTMAGHPYVLGIALHDLQRPHIVQMSSIPILFPSQADCRVGEADYVRTQRCLLLRYAAARRRLAAHLLRRERHCHERGGQL